ncbi:TonB-dependent receptor, partial [Rhodospirillum rubrum]|nr:TonB-dependent receptor [Rhodospirillum rubrum]
MKMQSKFTLMAGAASAVLLMSAGATLAQEADPATDGQPAQVEDIVVVGSQIRGASTTAALPVTVVTQEEIIATGAVSGDDLLRSIPQMGDVLFSSANNPQTSNAARGDVNSVNLRSLGVGNTLVLLNGRRIVQHPTSQGTSDTGTVPVLSYNSNAIPVSGLERLEVLLDGAAAIYGADAVAGVVNTVLQEDFDGLEMKAQYGGAEGAHRREFTLGLFAGKDFERGNISGFLDYTDRTAQRAEDMDYTASDDRRALFADVPGYETSTDPDGRSSYTSWANFQTPFRVRQGTTNLTSAAGAFHNQPSALGCTAPIGGDVCLASGNISYSSAAARDLRYDGARGTTVSPDVERLNLFVSGHYDLDNGVTAFGELGYYTATTQNIQPPTILLNQLWIPASNYWNPFGPITFADGTANPNRLPGLTNVPAEGTDVKLVRYRFNDVGEQVVNVDNWQSRILGGLRGEWRGFDWESAILYSKARTTDEMDGVSMTGLQAAINMTTANAYNPFVGGDLDSPKDGAFGLNDQDVIDGFKVKVYREAETELMMWDFKASKSDFYEVPAGYIGVAGGVEARRETFAEDRDPRLDGTITFTDLGGGGSMSDVMGVSYTPDSSGARNVYSAFLELAVPVVSPEMNIPLVQSIDLQLAGRVENYSLFGTVGAPKVALAYRPTSWLMFRSAWSQGFRAPNLLQLHQPDFERSNARRDYAACAVQLAIGAIETLTESNDYCTSEDRIEQRAGNKDLKAEDSDNLSLGLVFEPKLWPEPYGELTFTVDYWKIRQENLVGIFGGTNQLIMDYYLRQIGSSNPNVIRADPDAQQIADATAAGLAPVGTLLSIKDDYLNLQPRESEGLDLRLLYNLRDTPWGDWRLNINASQKLKLYQEASEQHQVLLDALEQGVISSVTVGGVEDLVRRNGRPEWKVTASLTWNLGPWTSGWYSSYVSDFYDSSATDVQTGDYWTVDEWLTHNLYLQYRFDGSGPLSDTRIRVGARNIFD